MRALVNEYFVQKQVHTLRVHVGRSATVREQFTSLLAAHLAVNVILAPLLAPLEDDWAAVGLRCAGITACVAQYLQTLCKEDALMYYKEGFTELFYTKGRCYTALSIAALPTVPATCPLCERTLL